MRLCRVCSLPYYMFGCLASGFRALRVMLTPFLWASSLGQQAKTPGEATQPAARWSYTSTRTCFGLSVRRCCRAGVAEPMPFFLSPDFEFCLVFGTHPRLS